MDKRKYISSKTSLSPPQKLRSPSPDNKTNNRVQPTFAPMKQINKYFQAKNSVRVVQSKCVDQQINHYQRNNNNIGNDNTKINSIWKNNQNNFQNNKNKSKDTSMLTFAANSMRDHHENFVEYGKIEIPYQNKIEGRNREKLQQFIKKVCEQLELQLYQPADFYEKDQAFRLEYLIRVIAVQGQYLEQYKHLAERNKRMQTQMFVLLQQIQTLNQKNNEENKNTPRTAKSYSSPGHLQQQQNYSRQYLNSYRENQQHTFIESLQNTVSGLQDQVLSIGDQMKRNVKRDMTNMEQRLMNYIFSLEEKLSSQQCQQKSSGVQSKSSRKKSSTEGHKQLVSNSGNLFLQSKNKTLINQSQNNCKQRLQSSFSKVIVSDDESSHLLSSMKKNINRKLDVQFQQQPNKDKRIIKMSQKSKNSSKDSSDSIKNNQNKDDSISTPVFEQLRKYSNNSGVYLDISESSLKEQIARKNIQKQQQQQQQLPKNINRTSSSQLKTSNNNNNKSTICKNCLGYISKIKSLQETVENLQIKTQKFQQQIQQKINQQITKQQHRNSDKMLQNVESQINVVMVQSSVESFSNSRKLQTISSKGPIQEAQQSNYNSKILIEDYSGQSNKKKQQEFNQEEKNKNAERWLILGEIKNQLINLMQEIQGIVHYCQAEQYGNSNNILEQLNNKILYQSELIIQLEEDLSRVRLELESVQDQKKKVQRMFKMQVREEEIENYERKQPPSFRMIKQPISCVNHKQTKKKIDHILESIRSFGRQVDIGTKSAPVFQTYTEQIVPNIQKNKREHNK